VSGRIHHLESNSNPIPMETIAFASLAHLKIIIIPVGPIAKPVYDKWNAVLRTFESIPLVDVPPARHDDRSEYIYVQCILNCT
jgi:hypothetical protein